MDTNQHDSIIHLLGELKSTSDGINRRLDTLNGSVAKHEARLNGQDIMNAQTTISQVQIVKDIANSQKEEKEFNAFILQLQGSINTFKWLFGFVGIGTLLTALRVLQIL